VVGWLFGSLIVWVAVWFVGRLVGWLAELNFPEVPPALHNICISVTNTKLPVLNAELLSEAIRNKRC